MPRNPRLPKSRFISAPRKTYTGKATPDPVYHFTVRTGDGGSYEHDGTHVLMSEDGVLTILNSRGGPGHPPTVVYAGGCWTTISCADPVAVEDPDPDEAPVPAP